MSKYVQVKVFRDIPKDETEYRQVIKTIPEMIRKLHEANDYMLTYLTDDEIVEGAVYVAPYGKQTRIVVVQSEADPDEIKSDINYRHLIKKIGDTSDFTNR